MVDATDVEEVVFVVVSKQAFHLGGIHAAIGLANIKNGKVQRGKDINFDAGKGKQPCKDDTKYHDANGDGSSESKVNRVHAWL